MALAHAIEYRPLREALLPELQALFVAVFGKQHSLDYLRAKYDTQYLGLHHVAHFAFVEGKAVAFAGATPMPFLLNGKPLVGVQLCDYMTLPAFRRMGIHTALVQHNLDLAAGQGADFAFAMHTNESIQGDAQIKWQLFPPLQVFVLPLQPSLFRQVRHKLPQGKTNAALAFRKALQQFESTDISFAQVHAAETLHVAYSAAFMRYKSYGNSFCLAMPSGNWWLKAAAAIEIGFVDLKDAAHFQADLEVLLHAAELAGYRKLFVQMNEAAAVLPHFAGSVDALPGYMPALIALKAGLRVETLHLNAADFDTF